MIDREALQQLIQEITGTATSIAGEMGVVMTVEQRHSEPHRQMLARLDMWRSRLLTTADRLALLVDVLGSSKPEKVTCAVSAIRQGEDNDGPLESTDLYIRGRGMTCLVNVPADAKGVTYTFNVDGGETKADYLGVASADVVSPVPQFDPTTPVEVQMGEVVAITPETIREVLTKRFGMGSPGSGLVMTCHEAHALMAFFQKDRR